MDMSNSLWWQTLLPQALDSAKPAHLQQSNTNPELVI